MKNPIQTRSEETGLNQFASFEEAINAAIKDLSIWKISFTLNGKRVRLIRYESNHSSPTWFFEKII